MVTPLDKACVKEGFQLAMSNLDKNSEGGRKALDMGDCSINISDGSELELTLSKKISSYFESNFQIFLFSCISKTSILKVHDVLH